MEGKVRFDVLLFAWLLRRLVACLLIPHMGGVYYIMVSYTDSYTYSQYLHTYTLT